MSNNKGIPTVGVRGIQFRSRIEAQWAYIFEKLEWNWEYEPLDLNGYIPDFIIKFDDEEILIEIKGDTNIWKEEVYKPHIDKILQSGWKGQFGILGSVYKITNDFHSIERINIGKLYQNKWKLYGENNHILENNDIKFDDLIIVFSNTVNKYYIDGLKWKEILECPLYERKDTFNDIREYFQKIWVEAKNKVQWKGIQNTKQIKDKILNVEKNTKKQIKDKILDIEKDMRKGYVDNHDGNLIKPLKDCDVCNGSGISYWSDDIYDSCMECCFLCNDKKRLFKVT
tara:strand:+ start:1979 stop:2830 length:852 start_codon:yes stop_codon:yes gene_type:complete